MSPSARWLFSGILETFDWRPADPDSRDAAEMWDVQNALDAGLQPEDTKWPSVRVNTEQTWHWENWVVAWNTVGTYIFNTIVVAVCAVILALTCSTAAAFFFARHRMPGSTFLWYFFLVLMLMPGVANLVPLFILLRDLGMINSLLADHHRYFRSAGGTHLYPAQFHRGHPAGHV